MTTKPTKLGRPRKTKTAETISLRLPGDLLKRLDALAREHGNRPEAIRYLLSLASHDTPAQEPER